MKANIMITGLALGALVLTSTSLAVARDHRGDWRGDGGPCVSADRGFPGSAALSPEKRAEVDKLVQAHMQAMEPKRQELDAKQMELRALSGNPNAKPETVTKLAGDIARLRGELRASRLELGDTIQKETGVALRDLRGHAMAGHDMAGMDRYHGQYHGQYSGRHSDGRMSHR